MTGSPPAPAAYVLVVAYGPQGTAAFDSINDYVTNYQPPELSCGSVNVSVDTEGRYRFDIGGLELIKGPFQIDVHPDSPRSISLQLNNGYVP